MSKVGAAVGGLVVRFTGPSIPITGGTTGDGVLGEAVGSVVGNSVLTDGVADGTSVGRTVLLTTGGMVSTSMAWLGGSVGILDGPCVGMTVLGVLVVGVRVGTAVGVTVSSDAGGAVRAGAAYRNPM